MGMKRLLQEQNTQLKVTHVNPEPSLNFREREKERVEREEGREGWRKGERESTLIPWDVAQKKGVKDI